MDFSLYPQKVWKISHGSLKPEQRKDHEGRRLITIHSHTGRGQARGFNEEMKKGDFFYLCYGSHIQLLGQVTSECKPSKARKGRRMSMGWLERKYKRLWLVTEDGHYKGYQRGWTPNYNSTCMSVPAKQFRDFEKRILFPYFGKRLDGLPWRRRQPRLEQELESAGFQQNSRLRRIVEVHAMKRAKRHYEAKGYEWHDVSATKPYDLFCEKNGKKLYIEVKGTQSKGHSVILTTNEVKHLRKYARNSHLFLVRSIWVSTGRDPVASGGVAKHYPWRRISGTSLRPLAYQIELTS
jgi:hypothetical protein